MKKLLLSCLMLASLAAIWFGVRLVHEQAERVASFSKTTTATVLETRMHYEHMRRHGQQSNVQYQPVVRFEYEANGQTWTADTIYPERFRIGGNLGRVAAKAPLDQFQKGQSVTAYYNPENPAEACLIPRPSILPYLLVLAPMIIFAGSVAGWPVPVQAASSRRKALLITVMWYAIGLLAATHYLFVAGWRPAGAGLAILGLYLQSGLIPLHMALPSDPQLPWARRAQGAIIASLVGTFLGFWLGLGIGLIASFCSASSTFVLICWGYTPAFMAMLFAYGGWNGAAGEDGQPAAARGATPTSWTGSEGTSPATTAEFPSPDDPGPYGIDARPVPDSLDVERLLPVQVGPFRRAWVDHRADLQHVPTYAQYQSAEGEVFVELGVQASPADARQGLLTARAETVGSFADVTQSSSMNTEPSYYRASTPQGEFFAWTRGRYYFSAHVRGSRDLLDQFMEAFPY